MCSSDLEKPRLSKFTFSKGVSKSEADKIREKIHLERDKVITENVLNNTKNTVRDFYIEKGFLNTKVEIKEYKDTLFTNRDILEIIVDKSKKVKINDIIFTGVTAVKEGKLRRAMKGTKTKRFYKIFTTSKFQESVFEEDKTKLIAKYLDLGYRDAKITESKVTPINDKRLNISLTIDEGHKYFFRNKIGRAHV